MRALCVSPLHRRTQGEGGCRSTRKKALPRNWPASLQNHEEYTPAVQACLLQRPEWPKIRKTVNGKRRGQAQNPKDGLLRGPAAERAPRGDRRSTGKTKLKIGEQR